MTAGFGLEKLGLLALRYPRAVLLLLLALLPVFLFSAGKLEYSSDIREIFRTGAPEFAVLDEVRRQYPGSDQDILLVVQGADLFRSDTLEQLITLHLDLGLTPGVAHTVSMFSARHPPDAEGQSRTLFPADLTEIRDMAALERRVLAHPLVKDKLLSADGTLALFIIALDRQQRDVAALQSIIGEIESLARETLEGSDTTLDLTGLSVMRVEIIGALIRDQRLFAAAGLTIGLLLCWLFFRSLAYALIASAPAIVANTWLLGGMQMMGQEVNVLTNVIPVLVMVIVFADALHLLFAIRRHLEAGTDLHEAIARSVRQVGPACVLTSLTTTIALLSLLLVPQPFIAHFGRTAALGTAIAYLATMTTVPALSALLLGRLRPNRARSDRFGAAVDRICSSAAGLVAARPRSLAICGLLATLLAGGLYALNEPRYRYTENLPADNDAFRAITTIDRKLAGPNTLRLHIQWPRDHRLSSMGTLDLVREAHEILSGEPTLKSVWSLYSVEQWMADGGLGRGDLFRFLEKANSPLSTRILSRAHNSALITANFPDVDASVLNLALDRLDQHLDRLRNAHPGVRMTLTGLVPLSARASYDMIGQLNRSLLFAVGVIIVLIGIALRSVRAGLVSILPNLLPLAAGGACLYLFDRGLQFTSVIAFTVGFGIAVDSTIHVLHRYRLGREAGAAPANALSATIEAIGPVLIVSTVVLVAGVGTTVLSELPMVRLYGQISIVVLVTALVGDLLFLPAIVSVVDRWRRPVRDPARPQEPDQRRRLSDPDEQGAPSHPGWRHAGRSGK